MAMAAEDGGVVTPPLSEPLTSTAIPTVTLEEGVVSEDEVSEISEGSHVTGKEALSRVNLSYVPLDGRWLKMCNIHHVFDKLSFTLIYQYFLKSS